VPAAEAEKARALLIPLAPAGFEEVERGESVELVVYGHEAEELALQAAFPEVASARVEQGWEDAWRAFHRPVLAGGIWIRPPWEEAPAVGPTLVVDPGRAFGTGAHPTTRACIELLATLEPCSLLDAGCGSGVVACAGALLGFAPVMAVDVDPVAVAAAEETARRNALAIEVRQADALADPLPAADLVVANIELAVVEGLLPRAPAPAALTAGYYDADRPVAPGWRQVRRVVVEGWAADLLQRA
jgi:ribosomal protein L11 methyltransferase